MAQYSFGSGVLWGSRTDITPATPIRFGTLQDVSVDFDFSLKELYGQFQFPVAVGRGTAKISGKAKVGSLNGLLINTLFFGQSQAPIQPLIAFQEAGTVAASTPFIITVANSATWTTDLGVINAVTGLPLTHVASGPATGQYSVAAGVYTFASADTGLAMVLSYEYQPVSGGGNLATITNQLLGSAPTFKATLYETFQGKQVVLNLNQCISSKLTIATKLDDFTMPEFDFMAFADAAGNVGTIGLAE